MNFVSRSLPLKISLIILCIGSTALTLIGYHYVNRFRHEIDERIVGKLNIPGYLMSQRVLNLDVVADDVKALENLIGEEIIQAFVIKKDGTIFFTSDANQEGQDFTRYLHEKERINLTAEDITENQITSYTTLAGNSFLSILAPLRLQFEETIDGYLYLKINAEKIQKKKDEIVYLFFLGSTLTIVLTTLLEVLFVHVLIVPRISRTVSVLEQVEKGNLAAKIERANSPDELGHLQRSVNSMIAEIESASYALRRSEERYRLLFEEAPISLWEEDFSEIRRYFNHLRASGITDLPTYFTHHPEAVQHCAKLVKVLDINRATLELFDASDKQELQADLSTIFTEVSLETFREELIMLARGGNRFTSEVVQRTLRGEERQVILHLEVAPGYETSLGKILISLLDITKRKRAEEKLRQYQDHLEDLVQSRTTELTVVNEHLQQEIAERTRVEQELRTAKDAALEAQRRAEAAQRASEAAQRASEAAQRASEAANQAKSIFLANMSHELRTPLNAILGFAQLMVRDQSLVFAQRENLDVIMRSGEHLLTLINDVLDMSKIEAGRITLTPGSFDLYQMLRNLEDMLCLRAERKGLLLTVFCAPKVPQYITTDEAKLRQVLLNLLSNAIKFTEEGRISLRVSELDELDELNELNELNELDELENSTTHKTHKTHETHKLRFEVEDTGLGVAPEEMPTLFEAFMQTQSGRKVREGTGLGLAISQEFVHLMGGDITVSSQEGTGTTFSFEIQVESADQSTAANQQSTIPKHVISLAPDQPEYRILVVDDQYENRTFLKSLLQMVGFTVQEASHGEEAMVQFTRWHPRVIFLDIRMPGMDGHEVARRIRKLETQIPAQSDRPGLETRIVIVAVSASTLEEDQTRARAAGCDGFVHKPFRDAEIFKVLEQHLGVRYLYEENEEPEAQGAECAPGNILTPAALAALPPELLKELDQAVDHLNMENVTAAIAVIRKHDDAVAEALAALAGRFRYREIRKLLRQPLKKPETT